LYPDDIEEKYRSLRGQRLQVITKSVDYELEPGQSYKGSWHVKGMSHKEIVDIALYIVHRDTKIVGGDIAFKQAFRVDEDLYRCHHSPQHPADDARSHIVMNYYVV